MDPGHYGRQQGWENNSAFDGYGAAHEANFRGGVYDDRRFPEERYSRDNIHPRNAFHRDFPERENYPPPSAVGPWSQTRRRSHESGINRFQDYDKFRDDYRGDPNFRGYGHDKSSRFGSREPENFAYDDYKYKSRSRERDSDYDRRSYDSDYERGSKRESSWRSRESREKRGLSREIDRSRSPRRNDRSKSRGHDDQYIKSRSPRGRSRGREYRENSYDDSRYERGDRRRDREYSHENYSMALSATVVVRGLSQKTTEEDLYQILAEWGPIHNVRVVKECDSGISRGFAFLDFASVGAARALMDKVGDDGLVVDGRKLFFEYSSKPTGGVGGPSLGPDNAFRSGQSSHRSMMVPSDWICIICGCNNFARRTSCFQCNEPRTEDAPGVEMGSSNSARMGKKGDAGPTHVLVIRGLDENADEEMIRYEFSKHAPIKDIRLVRDKFTHVSRGFAFVHFHTVEDAIKALEATNGTSLEKNGQMLRVAFAKSVIGSGSGPLGSSHSSSLAAAAIEAAAFSQQYDAMGWAPKEYNPDEKQSTGGQEPSGVAFENSKNVSAPQSGFVWDEASGYYYDAASGFYYDGNTGLYYDGNNGIWYTFDQQTQQYTPCTDQNNNKVAEMKTEIPKAADNSTSKKVVISAPAATITLNEKAASLPDAVQAAANAAIAAEKKEKERLKEIRLASKSSILANKKKMNNVLSRWKQRSVEGQAPRVVLDNNDKSKASITPAKSVYKNEIVTMKENPSANSGFLSTPTTEPEEKQFEKPKPVGNTSGGTIMGVIRGSGRGIVKPDVTYSGVISAAYLSENTDAPVNNTPFRTDLSALGSYTSPVVAGSGKRRFSESPAQLASAAREQPQSGYRDRAAERRSLYGLSSSLGDDVSDRGVGDSNRESGSNRGMADPTPFPPGFGRGSGEGNVQNYEAAASVEKAIDENNVGNRMLRNMGWQEGLGLGKDGTGMVEPVQAQATEKRAGLGSQQKKPTDPNLEVHAGDSYRTVIQKKAIARFREMN